MVAFELVNTIYSSLHDYLRQGILLVLLSQKGLGLTF